MIILTAICEKVDRSSNAGSNGFACSSDLGLKGCNLRSCWKKRQNQKIIQIKTFKPKDDYDILIDSIDVNSLELFAEMMRDRYGNGDED